MKVTELYNIYKENGSIENVFSEGLLTVNKYVPIFAKQHEIDTVLDIIIDEDEAGMVSVKEMDKSVSFILSCIALYVNGIELDEETDGDELADMLIEMEVYDTISRYTEDARVFNDMFEAELRARLSLNNSVGAVLNKHLTQLNLKLSNTVDKFADTIANFDMSPERMKDLATLLSHINNTVGEVKAINEK